MTETRDLVERVRRRPRRPRGVRLGPVAPGARPRTAAPDAPAPDPADASLLALVDRLTAILERSDLGELEVASGGTTIILRSPSAIERPTLVAAAAAEPGAARAMPPHPARRSGRRGTAPGAAAGRRRRPPPSRPSRRR